jgi:hypothetical protein
VQGQRDHHRIEGLTRADEAIDSSRIAGWAEKLTEGERKWTVQRLRGIGSFFGYSFQDLTAREQLSDSGSLLFGGEEVRARLERFPQLNIQERGSVPVAERLFHPRELMVIPNPYGRPRFVPGEPDAALPPPDSRARVAVASAVNRLPGPVRTPAKQLARRMGVERRRAQPVVAPPPSDDTE